MRMGLVFLIIVGMGMLIVAGCRSQAAEVAPLPDPTAASLPTATPESADEPTSTAVPPTSTPEPTPAPTPTAEPTPIAFRSSLSGLAMDSAPKRPIAIQVDNHLDARPHTGLTHADLIYETPTEADITRFTAFYQTSAPETVGPVRSARLVDLEIVPMHDAILAYSGASNDVMQELLVAGLDLLGAEGNAASASWRSSARYAPHNLFISVQGLLQVAENFGWSRDTEAQSFLFTHEEPEGTHVSRVIVPYAAGEAEFIWNESTGRWERWMAGVPHSDGLTGEQIAPRNVVVLSTTLTLQSFGVPSHRVQLQGSGDGWVYRDGKQFAVRWERNGVTDILSFTDVMSGEPVGLGEGQTWICLVPQWLTATVQS